MIDPVLRLATYNLQKCVGLDLRRRPDRTLSVIAALKADIVVLQEADKRLAPRPAALPHGMAEQAGWQVVRFGTSASLGWHGNALLIRPGLFVLETSQMDLPGLEPRGAIRADLGTPLGAIRLVGLHLGLVRRDRLAQVREIMRHLDHLPPCNTILAGDFNEWASQSALDSTVRGLRFVPTPPSYPAPRPVARLDRIAHSPALQARASGHHRAKPAHIASDHLPVWADLARTP